MSVNSERDDWCRQRQAEVDRRQKNTETGREIWNEATRFGKHVLARTEDELASLGALARGVGTGVPRHAPLSPLRQAALNVDTAVRGAADVLTGGLGAEIAAAGETLVGRGNGGLGQRYAQNLADQEARDHYDASNRRVARTVGEVGGTAALYRGGAARGTTWSRNLPSRSKGALGEIMSLAKTVSRGDIPVKVQVKIPLSKSYTVADHRTLRKQVVEAKFGDKTSLRTPQRRARRELPDYRVDWWRPHHFGRVTGTAAGAIGWGGEALNDDE